MTTTAEYLTKNRECTADDLDTIQGRINFDLKKTYQKLTPEEKTELHNAQLCPNCQKKKVK